MRVQRFIQPRRIAIIAAFAVGFAICDRASAELVLRLDAMDAASLSLSSEVTNGTLMVGGVPAADPRATGLKFVNGWNQSFGATSNPSFSPGLVPQPDADNIYRPTYDPSGLGVGKPSINFDVNSSTSALSSGQRLYAALDNFLYSQNYSIFFVGQLNTGDLRLQSAFGQDMDFRPEGWSVGLTSNSRWKVRVQADMPASGSFTANAPSGAAANAAAAVRSVIGKGTSIDFDTTNNTGATTTLNTAAPSNNNLTILSGGEFIVGNRGGTDTANSAAFNGKISEIAIFNTQLDTTQRAAINAYLSNKWLGAPAPTAPQTSIAQGLLQQAPPTVGAPQLVRYQFFKESPATSADDNSLLDPDLVRSGVTATKLTTGNPISGTNFPDGISSSPLGVAGPGINLVATTPYWNATTPQTPFTSAGPNYLTFTVTPDSGKQIDPSKLAFTLARGTAADFQDIKSAADSYGVWVNSGSGFVEAGGQVGVPAPIGAADVIDSFFDTYTVDLSGLPAFTQATEIRIYFWHHGPQTTLNTSEWRTRVDNVRLLGDVQTVSVLNGDFNHDGKVDAADYVVWRKSDGTPANYALWRSSYGASTGSGTGSMASAEVPEPVSASLLLVGTLIGAICRGRRSRRGNRCAD